jgi:hypothetical protein
VKTNRSKMWKDDFDGCFFNSVLIFVYRLNARRNLHQPQKSTSNAKIIDLNCNIFGKLKRQKSKILKTFKNIAFELDFGSIPVFTRLASEQATAFAYGRNRPQNQVLISF